MLAEQCSFVYQSNPVLSSRNDIQRTADFNKGVDGGIHLFDAVRCGQLHPNASLALWHHLQSSNGTNAQWWRRIVVLVHAEKPMSWWCAYWVAKANDVDASLEHLIRKLGGQLGVIQHDGANGVVPESGIKMVAQPKQ